VSDGTDFKQTMDILKWNGFIKKCRQAWFTFWMRIHTYAAGKHINPTQQITEKTFSKINENIPSLKLVRNAG